MQEIPAIFISHGAPDLLLSHEPARQAIETLGRVLPRPRGILVISAHWLAEGYTLGEASEFATIHDFGGFPAPLYQLQYPARGADWLIETCRRALSDAGLDPKRDDRRGLDHGAWIPLLLAWPEAQIPVLSLSLCRDASSQQNLELGRALAPLRKEGILVLASGAITHNLGALLPPGSPPEPWAQEFRGWVENKLATAASDDLVATFTRAPHARRAHPTTEHFDPLMVAYGAGEEHPATLLHRSFSYGNIAMDIYAFGGRESCGALAEEMAAPA